jgi:c-di-GMP-binding flagellar brake protein YcgR
MTTSSYKAKLRPDKTSTEKRSADPLALRKDVRCVVDSSANIHLIKFGVRLRGRIEDLSPGGCRIRTEVPFSVGIYVRTEVDFNLDGLPFRMPGVTQAIYDKHTIGIRFLEMSSRKREQLLHLIEYLKEDSDPEAAA